MTRRAPHSGDEPTDSADVQRPNDPVESVEAYREDETVVLYDAHNPLAWVEAEASESVPLTDRT
jgi:hypothetical protein